MPVVWPGPEDYEAYCAPVRGVPAPSESEFVGNVIAERGQQGLAVDAETVRRAIENSERPDYQPRGFFLTSEEQAELDACDSELPVRARALVSANGGAIGQIAWCWLNGLRGLRVSVKHDVEPYRALLNQELGSDRVIVTKARYAEQELHELQHRITQDVPELLQLGIDVCSSFPQETGVSVQFFGADRGRAMAQLGTPGSCTARELPDRVIVTLTVLAPQGFRTAVGGFNPSHATVEFAEPLGERVVIDAAENDERPSWTERRAGPRLSRHHADTASTTGRWLPPHGQ